MSVKVDSFSLFFLWKKLLKEGLNLAQKRLQLITSMSPLLDSLSGDRFASGRGFKSLVKSKPFLHCVENMSFVELKYFFDIVLKNRVIGGQEHKLLNCWHPDAQDYLSVISDLKVVTSKLYDPKVRLKDDDLDKSWLCIRPPISQKSESFL